VRRHLTLEEISAWFDGELELGDPEHKHLRECAECGAVLDGHSRLRRLARQAMPAVPSDAIWRAVSPRLAPAPAPVLDHGVPVSRSLVVRPDSGSASDSRRPAGRRLRLLVSRALPFLIAVAGIAAVLLLLPRTPRSPAPAGAVPAPRPPQPAALRRAVATAEPKVPPGAAPATSPDKAEIAARLQAVQARHGRIVFDLGRAKLDPASGRALREVAAILSDAPEVNVIVEGHTDNTGSAGWNVSMSQARAEAVVRWLVERGGIDARRLSAKGWGSAQPIADNSTEAGQAANRRVEFAVAGVPPAAPAAERVPPKTRRRSEPADAAVVPRQTYTGTRFILTADRFTTADPDVISAAGHVRVEPATPGEPYFAIVDGFSRTLTGPATGVVGEVVNPGEHLILHTGTPGVPVHPVP